MRWFDTVCGAVLLLPGGHQCDYGGGEDSSEQSAAAGHTTHAATAGGHSSAGLV
jgi:hypothetical protein